MSHAYFEEDEFGDELYVLPIGFDGKTRHVMGRVRVTYDGGMIEMIDPVTDEIVGCSGSIFARTYLKPLEYWVDRTR